MDYETNLHGMLDDILNHVAEALTPDEAARLKEHVTPQRAAQLLHQACLLVAKDHPTELRTSLSDLIADEARF